MRDPVRIAGPTNSGKTILLLSGLASLVTLGKKGLLISPEMDSDAIYKKLETELGCGRMRLYLPIIAVEPSLLGLTTVLNLIKEHKPEVLAIDNIELVCLKEVDMDILADALGDNCQLWYTMTTARRPRKLKAAA